MLLTSMSGNWMISPVMTSLKGWDRYPLVCLDNGAAKAAAIARVATGCRTAREAVAILGASLDIFMILDEEEREERGNQG